MVASGKCYNAFGQHPSYSAGIALKKRSPDLSPMPKALKERHKGSSRTDAMHYEPLVAWAQETWEDRSPGRKYVTIWASTECSNMLAHAQVKAGRRMRGKARYEGMEMINCPLVTPIS